MLKAAFLIMHMWHAIPGADNTYGPTMIIVAMPSLSVCEEVGRQAKALADANQPNEWHNRYKTGAADYRCIEVTK